MVIPRGTGGIPCPFPPYYSFGIPNIPWSSHSQAKALPGPALLPSTPEDSQRFRSRREGIPGAAGQFQSRGRQGEVPVPGRNSRARERSPCQHSAATWPIQRLGNHRRPWKNREFRSFHGCFLNESTAAQLYPKKSRIWDKAELWKMGGRGLGCSPWIFI